ncbi:SdiA-regulated domain-containing protein [bacterium]|nr:SdiA-regulated domain-containing protein [bacterium]
MKRGFVVSLFFALILGSIMLASWISLSPEHTKARVADLTIEASPWKFVGALALEEVPEPSGIAYHTGRDSFFVVDDGARGRPCALYEFKLVKVEHPEYGEMTDAEIVGKLEIGRDLEGVCINSTNELVYLVDEANEKIYEIAPDGPTHLRTFRVILSSISTVTIEKGGNGFEGITFRPMKGMPLGGVYYLANQDDPTCVVKVVLPEKGCETGTEPPKIKIQQMFKGEQINLGDLMYYEESGKLWLSHAWQNLLEIIDPDSGETLRWELMPGCAQEGITIDGEGRLWIAQDVGGVAVYVKD